jgi:Family of unknown function (DUF6152)
VLKTLDWHPYEFKRDKEIAMVKKLLALVVVLVGAATAVYAHHSFAAEFDRQKPVKVNGKIVKVEWMNPHIWIYVDGKDEISGRTAVWGFSAGPPSTLSRRGIKRDFLKVGDVVKVDGFLAKDGSANGSGGQITFPDGRSVFTAAAEDAVPNTSK